MFRISRREFGGLTALLGAQTRRLFAAGSIDETLRDGMRKRKISAVVAMVATPDKIAYTGALGKRDSASTIDVKPDSIFAIASMTKAVTSVAAMQLVERRPLRRERCVGGHFQQLPYASLG